MADEYFKLEDGRWLVDVPKLEMILPEANVVNDGENKMIFGFGPLLIHETEDGVEVEKMTLTLATKFITKPVEIHHDRDKEEFTYVYYKEYAKENPFCMNRNIVKDITNVEYMFNLISGGKVSTRLDWRDYITVVLNNMKLNKELDVSERDIEIMLAEYLRDANDPSKPVRLTGSDDYTVLSFRNLSSQQSTFNAVTFEDPETALTASLTRREEDETSSPLEKYMKM